MNKTLLALSLVLVAGGPVAAFAQTKVQERGGIITTTTTQKQGKHVEKITCREFLAIEDRFRPEAVSYAIGYTKAHKPKDAVIDVRGIDRLTPVIIKTCQARPQESLLQRVRAELHRL